MENKNGFMIWAFWALFVLDTLAIGRGILAQSPEKYNVLVLHSYHQGFAWTDNITTGITSVFAKRSGSAELYIEYMDLKRYRAEDLLPSLEALYASRYQHVPLDLILLSDDFALDFVLSHRETLFLDIPVVFCGINNFTPSRIQEYTAITGVTEDIDLQGTIELALNLHPNTQHIAVINDGSPPGQMNRERIHQIMPVFKDRLELIELFDLSLSELQQALHNLPEHTVILHLHLYTDKDSGYRLDVSESFGFVRQQTSLPIYTAWDFQVGYGATGGIVTNGEQQGRIAAEPSLLY